MYPRLVHHGFFALPTYGAFVALALLAAFFIATRTAPRLALPADRLWNLAIVATLSTLLGARLLYLVWHWPAFRRRPSAVLSVSVFHWPPALYGGLALAACASWIYIRREHLPLLPVLDALAPALALGAAITHLGAFVAGLDFGISTDLPWAVTYHNRLASLWYGVPLGTPLHPVQLYLAAIELLLFALLLAALRHRAPAAQSPLPAQSAMPLHRRQPGDLVALWAFVEGLAHFLLSSLRPLEPAVLPAGLSLSQAIALALVVAGIVLGTRKKRSPA